MKPAMINPCRPATTLAALMAITATGLVALIAGISLPARAQHEQLVELGFPPPTEDQLVHVPPTLEDLEQADLHPQLKQVIRRGRELFIDTQQLRGKN